MIALSSRSNAAKCASTASVVAAGLANPPAETDSRAAAKMSALLGPGAFGGVGATVTGKQSVKL
eukprot:9678859-Alexandrium_andersonii.AAC.1